MDTTCIAIDQGIECVAEATMTSPVPLCDGHQIQVALLVVPDILTAALRHAGSDLKPAPLPSEERSAVVAGARPKPVGAHMGGSHGPVVYFADTGARIKIGTSTNLRKRIRSLSLQEKDVVLLLQGGLMLERALHDTFAKERIDSTEWFAKSERLMKFIEGKRGELGVQPKQQPQRRVNKPSPAPQTGRAGARSLPEWANLALPLYQQYVAEVGRRPSGTELAKLMADAGYGEIKEARSRYIRNAAAKLAEASAAPSNGRR
ncbi:MAG TPA: GIY-YIG nuclease family protein [Arthrobacter sp.]|nr:GIY-YIG nuclease family protein [Arthrobacter sp.]